MAGLPFFGKKEIDHLVLDRDIGNERIKCIVLVTKQPILVICVYLPCDGQRDNYLSFVETVEQLQEIIIGGDFNENAVV